MGRSYFTQNYQRRLTSWLTVFVEAPKKLKRENERSSRESAKVTVQISQNKSINS